jgi:hypothetical protein
MSENPYQPPQARPAKRRPSPVYHALALAVTVGAIGLLGHFGSLASPEKIWPGLPITWQHLLDAPFAALATAAFCYVLLSSLRQ